MSKRGWIPPLVIALAIVVAYWRSFEGVFVFDDEEGIVENATIRDLSKLGTVLSPPFEAGQTVGGRPLVNLTLAANYAAGGLEPWGYHAVNLGIHIGAALLLYGVVRRTLRRPGGALEGAALLRDRTDRSDQTDRSGLIAWSAALLWALHPLQTEAVTYVIQRAESLMGALYLLTIYGFVRGVEETPSFAPGGASEGKKAGRWLLLSIASCFFGMATKEVMVSAPVIVLCYDRVFVSGSWMEGLRRRKGYYLGLATSWLLLGFLVISTRNRGGSMGLGLTDVGWWEYALTQFPAILHYLRLAAWPAGQIFDYGAEWIDRPWSVAPVAALVLGLAVAACWPVLRPKGTSQGALRAGFLGLFFFAILAPTSLVPANRQTISEHRMYLALAPLAVAAAAVAGRAVGRSGRRAGLAAVGCLALILGVATWRRQAVYLDAMALWTDNIAKRPRNPHAHVYLGKLLAVGGRMPEAKGQFTQALELRADMPDAHFNLGNVLMAEGSPREAVLHYEDSVRLRPQMGPFHAGLADAYRALGRGDEAIAQLREAIRLDPGYDRAHFNLGNALATAAPPSRAGMEEAAAEFLTVVRHRPEFGDARVNLIAALLQLNRAEDAATYAREGAGREPASAEWPFLLGTALAQRGAWDEARQAFERAVSLDPTNAQAQQNLARIKSMQGPPRP